MIKEPERRAVDASCTVLSLLYGKRGRTLGGGRELILGHHEQRSREDPEQVLYSGIKDMFSAGLRTGGGYDEDDAPAKKSSKKKDKGSKKSSKTK